MHSLYFLSSLIWISYRAATASTATHLEAAAAEKHFKAREGSPRSIIWISCPTCGSIWFCHTLSLVPGGALFLSCSCRFVWAPSTSLPWHSKICWSWSYHDRSKVSWRIYRRAAENLYPCWGSVPAAKCAHRHGCQTNHKVVAVPEPAYDQVWLHRLTYNLFFSFTSFPDLLLKQLQLDSRTHFSGLLRMLSLEPVMLPQRQYLFRWEGPCLRSSLAFDHLFLPMLNHTWCQVRRAPPTLILLLCFFLFFLTSFHFTHTRCCPAVPSPLPPYPAAQHHGTALYWAATSGAWKPPKAAFHCACCWSWGLTNASQRCPTTVGQTRSIHQDVWDSGPACGRSKYGRASKSAAPHSHSHSVRTTRGWWDRGASGEWGLSCERPGGCGGEGSGWPQPEPWPWRWYEWKYKSKPWIYFCDNLH